MVHEWGDKPPSEIAQAQAKGKPQPDPVTIHTLCTSRSSQDKCRHLLNKKFMRLCLCISCDATHNIEIAINLIKKTSANQLDSSFNIHSLI